MTTPIPDRNNHISCTWNGTRYVTLAELARRKGMTWMELFTLLKSFRDANHISIDKPVEIVFNGEFYTVDIIESLTTGQVFLTADVRGEDNNVD